MNRNDPVSWQVKTAFAVFAAGIVAAFWVDWRWAPIGAVAFLLIAVLAAPTPKRDEALRADLARLGGWLRAQDREIVPLSFVSDEIDRALADQPLVFDRPRGWEARP